MYNESLDDLLLLMSNAHEEKQMGGDITKMALPAPLPTSTIVDTARADLPRGRSASL